MKKYNNFQNIKMFTNEKFHIQECNKLIEWIKTIPAHYKKEFEVVEFKEENELYILVFLAENLEISIIIYEINKTSNNFILMLKNIKYIFYYIFKNVFDVYSTSYLFVDASGVKNFIFNKIYIFSQNYFVKK